VTPFTANTAAAAVEMLIRQLRYPWRRSAKGSIYAS
jgi:hypothetical protein